MEDDQYREVVCMYCGEKCKVKLTDSFFQCPFCTNINRAPKEKQPYRW